MVTLTIGELARKAGVGLETIRFYERQGLIEARRGIHRVTAHFHGRL